VTLIGKAKSAQWSAKGFRGVADRPQTNVTQSRARYRHVLIGEGGAKGEELLGPYGRVGTVAGKTTELTNHVERLCGEHGIQFVERKARGGWARKRDRTISVRPVKTERTYIIALHEIGHLIGPHRGGRRLEQEAAAWDFVIERSIVPLSPASYAFMLRCLESYLHRATFSRRAMVIPEKGHRFWATYAEIGRRAADRTGRASGPAEGAVRPDPPGRPC
jgi:hypothetical protein